jgi:hypothetical protein
VKIGVISDTHGYLDVRIPELFAGVDHILHGGDIGVPALILELEMIAPVSAVLGNTDAGLPFKETEIVQLAGRKFLLHHIVNPLMPGDRLKTLLSREQPDVVIFGHTHQQFYRTIGEMLFLNPGYAGKPKFAQSRSVAILHCDADGIRPEFLPLAG